MRKRERERVRLKKKRRERETFKRECSGIKQKLNVNWIG